MAKTLIARCPSCDARLRVALRTEGTTRLRVRCSRCAQPFLLRRPQPEPEATHAFYVARSPGPTPSAAGSAALGGSVASALEEPAREGWGPAQSTPSSTISGAGARSRTFEPGEMVAGRYRVVRFLAEGGMGEVYEAEDTALRSAVALKTVRPEMASDAGALERFKREIHVARQVSHRNVCRIHDLGSHRSASPVAALYPGGEILFVTMELLAGETLAERLLRDGPMSAAEALPLVEQMASALDAAHQAGVMHRDFKAANVMLVPESEGPRAVVTDFGLARGRPGGDVGATLTVAGSVMGSPAYMAPEQVEGTPATPAVDIYALGIVLFEMMTGRVPFRGDSALSTAVKRLTESPPPPSHFRADLDPRWEAAILRSLERDPESRFARASEMVAALREGAPVPAASSPARPAAPPSRRPLVLALTAVILLALAVALERSTLLQWSDASALQPPAVARPVVAVMGFRNVSGDQELDWLGKGLAEMLGTELSASGALRLVPGENVTRAKVQLELDEVDSYSEETLGRLRQTLGSDFVVTGSFTAASGEDGPLRLDLRLQDTLALEQARAVGIAGRSSQLFELVGEAGARLLESLGLGDAGLKRTWRPASTEAARLYSQGLEHLHRRDALGARELLEQAVAAEPRSPRVRAALAQALARLGFLERAQEEGRLAVELSSGLGETERMEIRGQYLLMSGDWEQAARTYEQLWIRYPDDLEYGLELAKSLTASGRAERALEVAHVLERIPSVAAGDVRILFAQASAAGALGRFREQREFAARAAEVSGPRGASFERAWALLLEGWALRNLGEPGRALEVTGEAEELYRQAGDAPGVAGAQMQRASLLFDQGELASARRLFERAVDAFRDLGDKGNEAQALNNLALVLRQQGQVDRALELYGRSLELSRDTGNRVGMAIAETNLGALELRGGDLAGAEGRFRQAVELSRQVGDRSQESFGLYNLGVTLRKGGRLDEAEAIHREALELRRDLGQRFGEAASLTDLATVEWERGRLARARSGYLEALELSRATGNRRFEAHGHFGLGKVHLAAGEIEEAEARYRQALALRRELGERGTVAESLLALAAVDLEQRRFTSAEEGARQAAGELAREGAVDLEALADGVRAQALVLLGRSQEAEGALTRVVRRLALTQDLRVRVELELAAARVAVALGRNSEAQTRLQRAEIAAQEAGLLPSELEARFLQAQLASREGDSRGSEMLAEVLARSRQEGLGLLERWARGSE